MASAVREPDLVTNAAYLAADPGERYVVYFTNGGSVAIDLSDAGGTFEITWVSVAMGVRTETAQALGHAPMEKTLQGGRVVTISAPYKGGWVAALVKQ